MFLRLLIESFLRQKRRKALAGIAILLGTTAVTAMLALATTIGDRIHRELAVYGANIIVTPKAANLEVNIGGVDLHPATANAYLHESDLEKLKTIFWANNITGVSPQLSRVTQASSPAIRPQFVTATVTGFWFDQQFGSIRTGVRQLHPTWRIDGLWPDQARQQQKLGIPVVLGRNLANKLHLKVGDSFQLSKTWDSVQTVCGIVSTGTNADDQALVDLAMVQSWVEPNAISRVEISARTRPEDAFARQNPDTLSPKQRDTWYCRPYANSIAYQIREAIPGADAQQVRRVEQSEGTVLSRISGLMWLISAAALLAAGFAVSAAMATAVLERRAEIGLMRSLGAGKAAIATLFYAESGLLALLFGTCGYLAGSTLAFALGRHIFPSDGPTPLFNPVLLPVTLALAIAVAILGSTPAIRSGLRAEVANILRGNQ